MKSLVLLSGGMDSATALALAIQQSEELLAISIQYGSLHEAQEKRAAFNLAHHYAISLRHVALSPDLFRGGSSALLGESEVPNEEYHDINKESPSVTVVPFRNANLISTAVAIAEAQGFDTVWMSVHSTDHHGWAYPDCSPEFIGAMAAAVYIGTLRKVRLHAPFLSMSKADIVRVGMQLNVPFEKTWSCYRGGVVSCGECPTCKERIKAFADAGFVDPLVY